MVYLELKVKVMEAQAADVLAGLHSALAGVPDRDIGLRYEVTGGEESLPEGALVCLDVLRRQLRYRLQGIAADQWTYHWPWREVEGPSREPL